MSEQIRTSDPGATLREVVARVEVLERTARFPAAPTLLLGYVNEAAAGGGVAADTPSPINNMEVTVDIGPNRLIRASTFAVMEAVGGTSTGALSIVTDPATISITALTYQFVGFPVTATAIGLFEGLDEGSYEFQAWYESQGQTGSFGVAAGVYHWLLVEDLGAA